MPIFIEKADKVQLQSHENMLVPGMFVPGFRINRAKTHDCDHRILLRPHGGLGDVICAEPAIRYATKVFKDEEITIDTHFPNLFRHLKFHEVNDSTKNIPDFEKYLVIDSMYVTENLAWEFVAHAFTHVVDHHSLIMFRCQLPVADREIRLQPTEEEYAVAKSHINPETDIVIHAGRTWQSRTIPKEFWNEVLMHIKAYGFRPVLIGKESYAMTGNLAVNSDGCLDLRNKLSVMETVALLHKAKVVLTNDSSPIHMAASGDAWIGFISTVKQPDFITHWRHGQFGWRMKNHSLGGMWQIVDMKPTTAQAMLRFDHVDPELFNSWLPKPKDFAEWACTQILQ